MKNIALFVMSFFFLLSLVFVSCASSFKVPGQKALEQKALYVEYLSIADAYTDLGKYDKAIHYYNLSLRDKSLYWQAKYKLALAHVYAKNYSEAEIIFQELLSRDKDNVNLKLSLAYLKAMSGNVDEAIVLYKALIAENPENETPLVNYLTILIATGRMELAEEELVILKERFPDSENIQELEKKLAE